MIFQKMWLTIFMSLLGMICGFASRIVAVSNVQGSNTSYILEIQAMQENISNPNIDIILPDCLEIPSTPECEYYVEGESSFMEQINCTSNQSNIINIDFPLQSSLTAPTYIKLSHVMNALPCTSEDVIIQIYSSGDTQTNITNISSFTTIPTIQKEKDISNIWMEIRPNTTNSNITLSFSISTISQYRSIRIKLSESLHFYHSIYNGCTQYFDEPLIQCQLPLNDSIGNGTILIGGLKSPILEDQISNMMVYGIKQDDSMDTFIQKQPLNIVIKQVEGRVFQQNKHQNGVGSFNVSLQPILLHEMYSARVKLPAQWRIYERQCILNGISGDITRPQSNQLLILNPFISNPNEENITIQVKVNNPTPQEATHYTSVIQIQGEEGKLSCLVNFVLEVEQTIQSIQQAFISTNPSIQIIASFAQPTPILLLSFSPVLPLAPSSLTCYIGSSPYLCSYNINETITIRTNSMELDSVPIWIQLPVTIQTQAYHVSITNTLQIISSSCVVSSERISGLECELMWINQSGYHIACSFINQFLQAHPLVVQLPAGAIQNEGERMCVVEGEFVEAHVRIDENGSVFVMLPMLTYSKQKVNIQIGSLKKTWENTANQEENASLSIYFSIISNNYPQVSLYRTHTIIQTKPFPQISNTSNFEYHLYQNQYYFLEVPINYSKMIVSLGDGLSTTYDHYIRNHSFYYSFGNYYVVYARSSDHKAILRNILTPAYSSYINSSLILLPSQERYILTTFIDVEQVDLKNEQVWLQGMQVITYGMEKYLEFKWSHDFLTSSAELSCSGQFTLEKACGVISSSASCSVIGNKVSISNIEKVNFTTFNIIMYKPPQAKISQQVTCKLCTYDEQKHPIGNKTVILEKLPKKKDLSDYLKGNKTVQRPPSEGFFSHLLFRYHTAASISKSFALCFMIPSQFDLVSPHLLCTLNQKQQQCQPKNDCSVLMEVTEGWNHQGQNQVNISTWNGVMLPVRSGLFTIEVKMVSIDGKIVFESSQFQIRVLPKPINYFRVSSFHREAELQNIFTFKIRTGDKIIPSSVHPEGRGRVFLGFPLWGYGGEGFARHLGYQEHQEAIVIPCIVLVEQLTQKNITCILMNKPHPQQNSSTYVQVIGLNQIAANTSLLIRVPVLKNPKNTTLSFGILIIMQAKETFTTLYQDQTNFTFSWYSKNVSTDCMPSFNFKGDVIQKKQQMTIRMSAFCKTFLIMLPLDVKLYEENYHISCYVFTELSWIVCPSWTAISPLVIPVTLPFGIDGFRYRIIFQFYKHLHFYGRYQSNFAKKSFHTSLTSLKRTIKIIDDFQLKVVDSSYNTATKQISVRVLASFTVPIAINQGGLIKIQFPSNASLVPSTCRSAISSGSQLYSIDEGSMSYIDCSVQDAKSWVISSFKQVPENGKIKIEGRIILQDEEVSGRANITTFNEMKKVMRVMSEGECQFNFTAKAKTEKWHLSGETQSQILRVGYEGKLSIKIKTPYNISTRNIYIILPKQTMDGMSGGFDGPYTKIKCNIHQNHQYKNCFITNVQHNQTTIIYQLTTSVFLTENYEYIVTVAPYDSGVGMNYPIAPGYYPIQIFIYSIQNKVVSSLFVWEVHDGLFGRASVFFNVAEPDQQNLVLVSLSPAVFIGRDDSIVLEFPTLSVDGEEIIEEGLGMKYINYQHLHFSHLHQQFNQTNCRVITGNKQIKLPAKIVCYGWDQGIDIGEVFQFTFSIRNPSISTSSIPITVYTLDNEGAKKQFQVLEFSAFVGPSQQTIQDTGNFHVQEGANASDFSFTLRNSRELSTGDYYLLKYGEAITMEGIYEGTFLYNFDLSGVGDVIFLKNCSAIALRVGQSSLPPIQQRKQILNGFIELVYQTKNIYPYEAYAIYFNSEVSERIIYKPSLIKAPNPYFTIALSYSKRYQGEATDYTTIFCLSQSLETQVMKEVKKISFEFPSGFSLIGGSCIEVFGSQIPIKKCEVDVESQVLWISIDRTADHLNEHFIKLRTVGYAVRNPKTSMIDFNKSVIKFYTWYGNQPKIDPKSDDFVLVRQDKLSLPSIPQRFMALEAQQRHTDVSFYVENFVNEFQLGNDQQTSKKKIPFMFKFQAMTDFPSLNDGQYHQINVKYGDYYFADFPFTNNDLKDIVKYYPSCKIQGKSQKLCFIENGKISMKFQDALSQGDLLFVQFSIINPTNDEDNGFSLKDFSNPLITLPIQFIVFQNKRYIADVEPFHAFYDVPDTQIYPSFGIASVELETGTNVAGKLNYLNFTIIFNRVDINGLVLQIPVIDEQGRKIYEDPTLLGLDSGAQYPCSVGLDEVVFCYYEKGSSEKLGRPSRIFISKFNFPQNRTLQLRLLFTNPSIEEVYPSFIFKALGGDFSNPQFMGNKLKGRYQISEAFKTFPSNEDSCNPYLCKFFPAKGLWSENNINSFQFRSSQSTQSYVVLEWMLQTEKYGEISQYKRKAGVVDEFIIQTGSNKALFLVKKLRQYNIFQAHKFGYLRNKHHLFNQNKIHLLKMPNYTCLVCQSNKGFQDVKNIYGAIKINKYDIKNRQINAVTWHYVSLDLGNLTALKMNEIDPADLILTVQFIGSKPYSSLMGTQFCEIQSGVTSTNKLKVVFCEQDMQSNQIVFRNINKFSANLLKFQYKARNIESQNVTVQIKFLAFANQDSFNTNQSFLFGGQTCEYTPQGLVSSCNGRSQLLNISRNQITFRIYGKFVTEFYDQFRIHSSFPRIQSTLHNCKTGKIIANQTEKLPISVLSTNFQQSSSTYQIHFSLKSFNHSSYEYYDISYSCMFAGDLSDERLWSGVLIFWSFQCISCQHQTQTGVYLNLNDNGVFLGGKRAFSESVLLAEDRSVKLLSYSHTLETQLSIELKTFYYPVGPSYQSWLNLFIDHPNISNPFPHAKSTDNAFIDCKCIVASEIQQNSSTTYQHPDCVRFKVGEYYSIGVWIDVNVAESLRCYFPGFFFSQNQLDIDFFRKTDLVIHQFSPRGREWSVISIYNGITTLQTVTEYPEVSVVEDVEKDKQHVSDSLPYQINITGSQTSNPTVYISGHALELSESFCNSSQFLQCRVYRSFMNRRYYVVAQAALKTSSIVLRGNATVSPSKSSGENQMFIGFVGSSKIYEGIWNQTLDSSQIQASQMKGKSSISHYSSDRAGMPSLMLFCFDVSDKTLFGTESILQTVKGSQFSLILKGIQTISCSSTFQNADSKFIPLNCTVAGTRIIINTKKTYSLEGVLHIIVNALSLPSSSAYYLTLYDQYSSSSINSIMAQSRGTLSFRNDYSNFKILGSQSIKWKRMTYKDYRIDDAPIRLFLTNNYTFNYSLQQDPPTFRIKSTGHQIQSAEGFSCFIRTYNSNIQFQPNQVKCSYHSSQTISMQALLWDSMQAYQLIVYRNNRFSTALIPIKEMKQFQITVSTFENNVLMFQNIDIRMRYEDVNYIMLESMKILTKSSQEPNSLFLLFSINKQYEQLDGFHYWQLEFDGLQFRQGITCLFSDSFVPEPEKQVKCVFEETNNLVIRVIQVKYEIDEGPKCKDSVNNTYEMSMENQINNDSVRFYGIKVMNFINPEEGTSVSLRVNLQKRYGEPELHTSYFPSLFFTTLSASMDRNSFTLSSSTFGDIVMARASFSWPFTPTSSDKLIFRFNGLYAPLNNIHNIDVNTSVQNANTSVENVNTSVGNVNTSFGNVNISLIELNELWSDCEAGIKVYDVSNIAKEEIFTFQFSFLHPDNLNSKQQLYDSSQLSLTLIQNLEVMEKHHLSGASFECLFSQLEYEYNITTEISIFEINYQPILNIQLNYTLEVDNQTTCTDFMAIHFTKGVEEILLITFRNGSNENIGLANRQGNSWVVYLYGVMEDVWDEDSVSILFVPRGDHLAYEWRLHSGNKMIVLDSDVADITFNNYPYLQPNIVDHVEQFVPLHYKVTKPIVEGEVLNTIKLIMIPPREINSHESIQLTLQNHQFFTVSSVHIKCLLYPTFPCQACSLPVYVQCSYADETFTIRSPKEGIQPISYILLIQKFDESMPYLLMPQTKECKSQILVNILTNETSSPATFAVDLCFAGQEQMYIEHSTFISGEYNVITFYITITEALDQFDPFIEIEILSENVQDCLGLDKVLQSEVKQFQSGDWIGVKQVSSPEVKARLFCGNQNRRPKILISNIELRSSYQLTIPMIKNPSIARSLLRYKVSLLNQQHEIVNEFSSTQTYFTALKGIFINESMEIITDNAIVNNNMNISIIFSQGVGEKAVILVKLKVSQMKGIKSMSFHSHTLDNYDSYFYEDMGLIVYERIPDFEEEYLDLGEFSTSMQQNIVGFSWVKIYPNANTVRIGQFDLSEYPFPLVLIHPIRHWSSSSFSLISGEPKTSTVGKYTFTFATEEVIIPSDSYIIINIDPIFSIPYQHCHSFKGLVEANTGIICQKHRRNQLRVIGYQSVDYNITISITAYLKLQKKSLGFSRTAPSITVFSYSKHIIVSGKIEPLDLNITKYGSFLGTLRAQMQKPYFNQSNQTKIPQLDINSSILHQLGNMNVWQIQITPDFYLAGDIIILKLPDQLQLTRVECVFEQRVLMDCAIRNNSIQIILPYSLTKRFQIVLFTDPFFNSSSPTFDIRVVRKNPFEQTLAQTNNQTTNKTYTLHTGQTVNLTNDHVFTFPKQITSAFLILQYCIDMILPAKCEVQGGICFIHHPFVIIITHDPISQLAFPDIIQPFMCNSTQLFSYQLTSVKDKYQIQLRNVDYEYVLQDYSENMSIVVEYVNSDNRAIVGKQAYAIIAIQLQNNLTNERYDSSVLENTLMTFIWCEEEIELRCENKTIIISKAFNLSLEFRVAYFIEQNIGGQNIWNVSSYIQNNLLGRGTYTTDVELIESGEGEVWLSNSQACIVGYDCTLLGRFTLASPFSEINITMSEGISIKGLPFEVENNNCSTIEISRFVRIDCEREIRSFMLSPGLVLNADKPGFYNITMDFLQHGSVFKSDSVEVEFTGTTFPQLTAISISSIAIVSFFTSQIPITNVSSLYLILPFSPAELIGYKSDINHEWMPLPFEAGDGDIVLLEYKEIESNSEAVLLFTGLEGNDRLALGAYTNETQIYKQTFMQIKQYYQPQHLDIIFSVTNSSYHFTLNFLDNYDVKYIIIEIESELSLLHYLPTHCFSGFVNIPCFLVGSTIILSPFTIITPPYTFKIQLKNPLYIYDKIAMNITASFVHHKVLARGLQQSNIENNGIQTVSGAVMIDPQVVKRNATYTITVNVGTSYKYLHEAVIQFPSIFENLSQVGCEGIYNVNNCSIHSNKVNIKMEGEISSFQIKLLGIINPSLTGQENLVAKLYENSQNGGKIVLSSRKIKLLQLDTMQCSYVDNHINLTVFQHIPQGSVLSFRVRHRDRFPSCTVTHNSQSCKIQNGKVRVYMQEISPNTTINVQLFESSLSKSIPITLKKDPFVYAQCNLNR